MRPRFPPSARAGVGARFLFALGALGDLWPPSLLAVGPGSFGGLLAWHRRANDVPSRMEAVSQWG